MSNFRKALLWTIIPVAGLAAISMLGRAEQGLFYLWLAAVGLDALAILVAVAFAIRRNFQAVAGIIAGAALGIVALGASCFANLSGSFRF